MMPVDTTTTTHFDALINYRAAMTAVCPRLDGNAVVRPSTIFTEW